MGVITLAPPPEGYTSITEKDQASNLSVTYIMADGSIEYRTLVVDTSREIDKG